MSSAFCAENHVADLIHDVRVAPHKGRALANPQLPHGQHYAELERHLGAQNPSLTNIHVTRSTPTEHWDTRTRPYRKWYIVEYTADD